MTWKRESFVKLTECPLAAQPVVLSGEQVFYEGRFLGLSARMKCSNHYNCHSSLEQPVDDLACVLTRLRRR
ncbi:MAG: hypothetical protein H6Q00_1147 [Holophagaceae bacterium]|nr:hypothetical protein [Holophagaceae bacterium]